MPNSVENEVSREGIDPAQARPQAEADVADDFAG
jgi:hypothetical protein